MAILFIFCAISLELVFFLLSPILFAILRKKPNSERLAINYPRKNYDIIVHAASVGEINGIRQLLTTLIVEHKLAILLTTNTKTGRKATESIHSDLKAVLSPLDILHLRIKQILRSKPRLILISETEIWPMFLFAARLYKIPVVFINARISAKTYKSYQRFKAALNYAGYSIKTICAQTDEDRMRFASLFNTECIRTGNLKFSVIQPEYDKEVLRREWGYETKDKIIVLGSSRPGEEELLLNVFDILKQEYPDLKLIIAPRHMDRISEIQSIMRNKNISYLSKNEKAKDIHLIDGMGHLLPAYALCDIAIIGGSFYPFGGHNPLEAAYYSRIIIMGQFYESCRGSVNKLKASNAIIISSSEKLIADLRNILLALDDYQQIGTRAKQVLEENRYSLIKHLEVIEKIVG